MVLVVAYHLWPNRLPGGYVGVDVFFVISGYLITAHLLGEVARTGTVSLSRFWARRVRRLLPAAFLVLIVSLVLAVTVAPQAQLGQNLTEIGSAALYVQNWTLAFSAIDYLGADNAPSLVQHYWSLSVEEQFYIAWPLIVVAALWLSRRLGRGSRGALLVAFAGVFVASLMFSVWLTATNPAQAYFVTPTRAWEFAAGGLLAFAPAYARSRVVATVTGWVAVAGIAYAALFYNADTPFPGWTAMLPVLATVALLHVGESGHRVSPQRLSAFRPVQLVGDTSYSIYLWHWPLIVAWTALTGGVGLVPGVGIFVVSVGLAVLTKRFVEDPFRSSSGIIGSRRRAYGFMAAGMVLILGAGLLVSTVTTSAQNRLAAELTSAVEDTGGCFGAYALDNACDSPYTVTDLTDPAYAATDIPWETGVAAKDACLGADVEVAVCSFGNTTDPTRRVAFVGDSHAQHLLDPMIDVATRNGWELIMIGRGGCSGFEVPASFDDANAQTNNDACVSWGAAVEAALTGRDDLDLVVFSARAHTKRITTADALPRLERIAAVAPVAMLTDVPGMPEGERGSVCLENATETVDPCAWPQPERPSFLRDAVEQVGGTVVPLGERLCTDGSCHAVIGGAVVYFDDNHVTTTFARTLSPWLSSQLVPLTSR